jgi:metal-responsive CopG/Arc/MetJ family transcriptional regulator
MISQRPSPERIAIPMPPSLIARIDEYRWRQRLLSRAAAIRQLIEIGLAHAQPNSQKPSP